jgi:phosphatidylserine decarboxylase
MPLTPEEIRNEKRGRMVREGYWYGLPLLLMAGGLVGFGLYGAGVFFLLVALFVLNFFRDPDRAIPNDPGALVSPADGRVVELRDETFDGRPVRRISIFMSPLDVHVNRSPVSGTIREVTYRKGSFRMASQAQASLENEQNVFTIDGEQGIVAVKQIAGVLARRIVFWKKPGDLLARGERVGLIKFGSRVDVLMDPEVELHVRVGDHVRAGSSILGISRARGTANGS